MVGFAKKIEKSYKRARYWASGSASNRCCRQESLAVARKPRDEAAVVLV